LKVIPWWCLWKVFEYLNDSFYICKITSTMQRLPSTPTLHVQICSTFQQQKKNWWVSVVCVSFSPLFLKTQNWNSLFVFIFSLVAPFLFALCVSPSSQAEREKKACPHLSFSLISHQSTPFPSLRYFFFFSFFANSTFVCLFVLFKTADKQKKTQTLQRQPHLQIRNRTQQRQWETYSQQKKVKDEETLKGPLSITIFRAQFRLVFLYFCKWSLTFFFSLSFISFLSSIDKINWIFNCAFRQNKREVQCLDDQKKMMNEACKSGWMKITIKSNNSSMMAFPSIRSFVQRENAQLFTLLVIVI